MALITLRQLLDHAAEYEYGVPAFNINNLEQIRAVMEMADETKSPVIIQASSGARRYAGFQFVRALILAATEEWPHIPICIHQDHGVSPKICQQSIQMGFTSVMMDGSLLEDQKTPSDYEYNVLVTTLVSYMAHACGVSVEGELGCLGSLETLRSSKEDGSGAEGKLSREQILTDPKQAADFVRRTEVDALAIAVGTSHGAYKFSKIPKKGTVLVIDRIRAIHEQLPNTHLVMHGSSSVPQEWLRIINEYGGKIPTAYGVPIGEIQESIRYGVRKINIDTDLRLATTGAVRRYLAQNPSQFDPRKYLSEALKAMKSICKMRYEEFGSAGQADKIKVISLEKMARRYKNTVLIPEIRTL
ncbi:fructose-bisphosphate aldolase class II [Coxiella endosymbiont of Amblyomma sculptum]|uniref:class II fructose-bisphosphate aldolase n=1 Tax=Coxiella endosymbiont of Amblyomma sculptum TaxID=2487929 RepID=UPI00132F0613|nr:class II fructose-bisphosphate aldolase [Coxiella endosymbiont of Amblyomma sculptum]QHG92227.1 fructose-bisphosphate aldolase class II [Coxiella endosymbiont of Amblyomma sculptum]